MGRTPLHAGRAGVTLAVMALPVSMGFGCPYAIRDAGFIVRDPSPYHLYLCVNDRTPEREHLDDRLAASATEFLADSNVEAEVVNLDRQPDHQAAAALASLSIRELPAAVLVSPLREAVRIRGLAMDHAPDEALRAVLAASVASPRREELKEHITEHWCLMVLAEGTDAKANERARAAAQAAAEQAVGMSTELGQTIEAPPRLLRLPADDPGEAVLLAALGLREGDPADPRLAVVFGTGRRLGPVLRGAEIAERSVLAYLETLGRSCACTSDPSELLGPSVPLVWDAEIRARVRDSLGFDPEKPEVRMVLAGVWQSQMVPGAGETRPFGSADEYVEFPVEVGPEPLPLAGADTERPPAKASLGRQAARALIAAFAVMFVVVVAVGAVVFLRRARSPD